MSNRSNTTLPTRYTFSQRGVRWLRRPGVFALVALASACSAAEPVAVPPVLPTPAVVAEEPAGELADFFGPDDDLDVPVEDQPVATPADPEITAEQAEPAVPAEVDSTDPAQPAVTISPATVPSFGEYTLEVRGSGFPAEDTVFVIYCVVPGGPISASTPEATVVAQLDGLNPNEDCNVTNTTNATTDAAGAFIANASGQVEQNSLVFAATTDGSTGAYALVPVGT